MGQKVRVTTKTRSKKVPSGYEKCRICKGKGYQKSPKRK